MIILDHLLLNFKIQQEKFKLAAEFKKTPYQALYLESPDSGDYYYNHHYAMRAKIFPRVRQLTYFEASTRSQ